MPDKNDLTQVELHRLLHYEPDTGIFVWLRPNRGRKSPSAAGRRRIKIHGHAYSPARLAYLHVMGEWPPDRIYHANGDPLDHRWVNLCLRTKPPVRTIPALSQREQDEINKIYNRDDY